MGNKASTRYLNLTETIYYATWNHTNLTMVNIFNHTVVQKCTYLYNHETYECSPHYNTQSNSMVILGDDNDGNDVDVRDLIFTTQSLVKRNKKLKENEKMKHKLSFHKNHKITKHQDAASITYHAHNIKSESSLKEEGDITSKVNGYWKHNYTKES